MGRTPFLEVVDEASILKGSGLNIGLELDSVGLGALGRGNAGLGGGTFFLLSSGLLEGKGSNPNGSFYKTKFNSKINYHDKKFCSIVSPCFRISKTLNYPNLIDQMI